VNYWYRRQSPAEAKASTAEMKARVQLIILDLKQEKKWKKGDSD